MHATCPNCKHVIEIEGVRTLEESPAVVCPQCRHLFFLRHFLESKIPTQDVLEESEPDEEPEGPPAAIYESARRHKHYLILLILLLLAVLAYQFSQSILSESARNEAHDAMARTVLRNLYQAQEAYYAASGVYASKLQELSSVFKPASGIAVIILGADASNWSAAAYHEQSPNAYRFDSANGGLDPKGFDRKLLTPE